MAGYSFIRGSLCVVSMCVLAGMVFGVALPVRASTTVGPFSAGTAQSGTTATCSDNMNWSVTTTDLGTNDTSYVSYSGNNWDSPDISDMVEASNFGFSISGTVLGVVVEIIGFMTQGTATYNTVQLMTVPGATPTMIGNNQASGSLPTTDPGSTYTSFGGSANLWNATSSLTSTQVSDAGFGVGFCWGASAANARASIDHVRMTITYDAAPTLSISQPDGVGDSVSQGSAYDVTYTLGDIDNVVTAAFFYDADNIGLDGTAISGACASAAEGTGATCSWDTTGVAPGNYYVYGTVSDGVNPTVSAYSSGQLTITAPATPPTVLTGVAGNISPTAATLFGTITSDGGGVTEHGFAYSTNATLQTGVSTTTLGAGSVGEYSNPISGLSSNTTYYYRAYASSGAGTGFGATRSFFTGNSVPTRAMRIFQGFFLKLFSGKMILYGN